MHGGVPGGVVKPRFGARGGARHVAVMGHELVCIIYAAGPTQPVGVGLVSEWYAGDRGMVVLLVRRRRPVGLYLHSERREGVGRGQSLEREFRWCESVVDGAQQAQRRGDGER